MPSKEQLEEQARKIYGEPKSPILESMGLPSLQDRMLRELRDLRAGRPVERIDANGKTPHEIEETA